MNEPQHDQWVDNTLKSLEDEAERNEVLDLNYGTYEDPIAPSQLRPLPT